MLNPYVVVRRSSVEGWGTFAKKPIPRGMVIWRFGGRDRIYDKADLAFFSSRYKKSLKHFAYTDRGGKLVYAIGGAQYSNHSCQANALLFIDGKEKMDIALRDIKAGEEVTNDYGLYMDRGEKMRCHCGSRVCRGVIKREMPSSPLMRFWRLAIESALADFEKVEQPLFSFSSARITDYLNKEVIWIK